MAIYRWPRFQGFALGNSFFGAVTFTAKADCDSYKYFGYSIGFDTSGSFFMTNGSLFGKTL